MTHVVPVPRVHPPSTPKIHLKRLYFSGKKERTHTGQKTLEVNIMSVMTNGPVAAVEDRS
jgi:hypothetical protein